MAENANNDTRGISKIRTESAKSLLASLKKHLLRGMFIYLIFSLFFGLIRGWDYGLKFFAFGAVFWLIVSIFILFIIFFGEDADPSDK